MTGNIFLLAQNNFNLHLVGKVNLLTGMQLKLTAFPVQTLYHSATPVETKGNKLFL